MVNWAVFASLKQGASHLGFLVFWCFGVLKKSITKEDFKEWEEKTSVLQVNIMKRAKEMRM